MKRVLYGVVFMVGVAVIGRIAFLAGGAWAAPEHPWQGKTVAYLGDSITDKCHVGCHSNYWNYLEADLGLKTFVYGKNGWQWNGAMKQAKELVAERGEDVDAIFVFMGTNDFNGNSRPGDWFVYSTCTTNRNGRQATLKRRLPNYDCSSVKGCVNTTLKFLKEKFPRSQIVLLTPIHRGAATFSQDNVQPDESFANELGLFIDDYVNIVKEAGAIWSVPVIDLHAESGIVPNLESNAIYMSKPGCDDLHPGDAGHRRLADVIEARLRALPPGFRN